MKPALKIQAYCARRLAAQFSPKGVRRFWINTRGVAAVEFALTLPLLVLFTFGIVQYALAFFTYNTMNTVARDGARALSVGSQTERQIETAALSRLNSWATSWTIDAQDIQTTGNEDVRMVISVPGNEAGLLRFLPMPEVLQVEVIMRKE